VGNAAKCSPAKTASCDPNRSRRPWWGPRRQGRWMVCDHRTISPNSRWLTSWRTLRTPTPMVQSGRQSTPSAPSVRFQPRFLHVHAHRTVLGAHPFPCRWPSETCPHPVQQLPPQLRRSGLGFRGCSPWPVVARTWCWGNRIDNLSACSGSLVWANLACPLQLPVRRRCARLADERGGAHVPAIPALSSPAACRFAISAAFSSTDPGFHALGSRAASRRCISADRFQLRFVGDRAISGWWKCTRRSG